MGPIWGLSLLVPAPSSPAPTTWNRSWKPLQAFFIPPRKLWPFSGGFQRNCWFTFPRIESGFESPGIIRDGSAVCVLIKKKVLVTQSCPTLCNPMDCSPPGSSVHGTGDGSGVCVLEQWINPYCTLESPGRLFKMTDTGVPLLVILT